MRDTIAPQEIAVGDAYLRLLAAIRKHRDTRGDDRCFQDDAELYAALPEGDTRPASDTAVTIENCRRYIECRQQGREYVSPQRRIEELESTLTIVKAHVIDMRRYILAHGILIGECVAWDRLKQLTGVGQDKACPSNTTS